MKRWVPGFLRPSPRAGRRIAWVTRLTWVFASLAPVSATTARGALDKRVEVPLVFEQAESALVDSFTTGKSSGWIWLPPTGEGEAHLQVGNVPFGFSVRTRLVLEYDSANVWPGNVFQCRAWIEPAEDPDLPEFYSCFGIEFGVKFRPIIVEWPEFSFGKDFCIRYRDDGPAPLGTNFLGGIDQVDTIQLPVADVMKGAAKPVVKAIANVLSGAGDAGLNMFSINLCAEGVLEGSDFTVGVGDHTLRFRSYGVGAATNFTLYVPVSRPDPYSTSYTFPVYPIYHHNFYQTDGLVLSLVSPLELWITPSIVERAGSVLGGNYQPPSVSLLHNGSYYMKSQSGASTRAKEDLEISLPITTQPDLPDLAIRDMTCNPYSDDRHTGGRAYAGETTTVRFTVANLGVRATQPDAWLEYSVRVDGMTNVPPTLLRSGGQSCVIPAGGATNLFFPFVFTEGIHHVTLRTGYLEVKALTNGAPVYGLGDANVNNNAAVVVPVFARPPRGTITGKCHPNPDTETAGIAGLQVWLHGAGYSAWATSSLAAGAERGTFRFERVPAGDYQVEYLVPSNGVPDGLDYVPKSIAFVHAAGESTDLYGGSGTYMLQFQNVMGIVEDPAHVRVSGVRAVYGDPALQEAVSVSNGVFRFVRVPPRGAMVCTLHHDGYESKRILFDPGVQDTWQTNTWIPSYYDYGTSNNVSGPFVTLVPDARPPALDVLPPPHEGACVSNLVLQCRTTDGEYKDTRQWRWEIRSQSGTLVQDATWADYATPSNRTDYVPRSWDLSTLPDGAYVLAILARDAAGLVTTGRVPFVRDTVAPTCTVSIAAGAASTGDGCADVRVQLSRPEPLTWSVELSNDGSTWSPPAVFSGTDGVIRRWRLAGDMFAGAVTVTARVTDAAGNRAGASDAINVDTSGRVQLAGGADFFGATNVPVDVRIIPPTPAVVYDEPSFGGQLDIGSHATNLHRAQAMTPAGSITVSVVRVHVQAVGTPGLLHLKLVSSLGASDPTGGPSPLAHVTLAAADVPGDGVWEPQFPNAVILPGATVYLLYYKDGESTQDFYRVGSGYSEYGNHLLRSDFVPGVGWQAAPPEPGFGCRTLAFRLSDDRRGRIRFATDGVCDAEPWRTYAGPSNGLFTAAFPGAGERMVAVQYENAYSNALNGVYYDSIWIDTQPPVVTGLTVTAVDPVAGVFRVSLAALDSDAGVDHIEWSIDGGLHWSVTNWQPTLELPYFAPFGEVRVRAVDRSGLTGATAAASTPSDTFPPSLGFWINDATAYTRSPTVTLHFAVIDDRSVTSCTVHVQELVIGRDYGPFGGGTDTVAVAVPATPMLATGGVVEAWVDGVYTFQAGVVDRAGHPSAAIARSIVLDRVPPRIESVELRDAGGRAWVTGSQFVAEFRVEDAFGPLTGRMRFNGGAWDDWRAMPRGTTRIEVDAPPPLPGQHVFDLEVQDGAGNCATGRATIRVNHAPATPAGFSPSGEIGSPIPKLHTLAFSDPDGDAFGAAEFVVLNDSGVVILHSGSVVCEDYAMPSGTLNPGAAYTWTARQMDADGLWSEWSPRLAFSVGEDFDEDGISDSVEESTGTDPKNDDSDGDGIRDGVEDWNCNGVVDAGETDPRAVDTDHDHLRDGIEDANRNGRRDAGETDPCDGDSDDDGLLDGGEDLNHDGVFDPKAGETSPLLSDTDGDGQSDRAEQLCRTNPNDIEGRFTIDGIEWRPAQNRLDFRWRGRAGLLYHLYAMASLVGTQKTLLSSSTPEGGVAPWYLVQEQRFTVTGLDTQVFFRIEVEIE